MAVTGSAATLGELVVAVDADTADLERNLKRAESKTQQSAQKMAQSLDNVESSAAGGVNSLEILGKTASASGSAMLGQATAVGELVASLGPLVSLLSGPVGIIAGLVALGAAFVALQFDIGGARTALFDWIEGVNEAKAKAEELDETLKGAAERRAKRIASTEDQLFIEELDRRGITGLAAEIEKARRAVERGGGEIAESQLRILERQQRREERRQEAQVRINKLVEEENQLKKEQADNAAKMAKAESERAAAIERAIAAAERFDPYMAFDKLLVNFEQAQKEQVARLQGARDALLSGTVSAATVAKVLGTDGTFNRVTQFAGARRSASFSAGVTSFGTEQQTLVKEATTTREAIERIDKTLERIEKQGDDTKMSFAT
jgi:hypothetical protein